jgi:hypothetical protein
VTAAVWTKLGGDTPIIGSVQTANFSAVQGTIHPVDSTGGVITVTPPAVVAAGDWFIVVDSSKLSAINNIVIATTAQLLLGQPDDFVLNSAGKSVKFLYISPAIGWSVSIS